MEGEVTSASNIVGNYTVTAAPFFFLMYLAIVK
jgi:hypothetical protein